jgi:hypothetical protein
MPQMKKGIPDLLGEPRLARYDRMMIVSLVMRTCAAATEAAVVPPIPSE